MLRNVSLRESTNPYPGSLDFRCYAQSLLFLFSKFPRSRSVIVLPTAFWPKIGYTCSPFVCWKPCYKNILNKGFVNLFFDEILVIVQEVMFVVLPHAVLNLESKQHGFVSLDFSPCVNSAFNLRTFF